MDGSVRRSRFDRLAQFGNEEEHVRMMGFGLDGVRRGLYYLHKLTEARQFTLPPMFCALFQSEESAFAYPNEYSTRWPLFKAAIRPIFQWMGESGTGGEHRLASGLRFPVAQLITQFACGQWFDLHILANGYLTKFCIDETGHVGDANFDTRSHDDLDIYQAGFSRRVSLPPRT